MAKAAVAVTRGRGQRWTLEEDGVLLAYVGTEPLARLARRLGRTERAVEKRAYERGLALAREAQRGVGMGLNAAAALLGVDTKTMWRWERRGWLEMERTRGRRQVRLAVSEAELCRFLAALGALLPEVRPTDPVWTELRDEARAALLGRYVQARELSRLLGYADPNRLLWWRRRRGFPAPVLDVGERSGGLYYAIDDVAAWLDQHSDRWTSAARQRLRRPA